MIIQNHHHKYKSFCHITLIFLFMLLCLWDYLRRSVLVWQRPQLTPDLSFRCHIFNLADDQLCQFTRSTLKSDYESLCFKCVSLVLSYEMTMYGCFTVILLNKYFFLNTGSYEDFRLWKINQRNLMGRFKYHRTLKDILFVI